MTHLRFLRPSGEEEKEEEPIKGLVLSDTLIPPQDYCGSDPYVVMGPAPQFRELLSHNSQAPVQVSPALLRGLPGLSPVYTAHELKTPLGELVQTVAESHRQGLSQAHKIHQLGPRSSTEVCRHLSLSVELAICRLFSRLTEYPVPVQSCLIATGSLARMELAPYSQPHLLLLLSSRGLPWGEEAAERLMGAMQEAGVRLQATVLPVESAGERALKDGGLSLQLLEARHLAGEPGPLQLVKRSLGEQLQATGGSAPHPLALLAGEVCAQRYRRRQRHGGAQFIGQPNVKTSPGGLVDVALADLLNSLLGRIALGDNTARSLLDRREAMLLNRTRRLLLWLRNSLHFQRGWKDDRPAYRDMPLLAGDLGLGQGKVCTGAQQLSRLLAINTWRVEEITGRLEECLQHLARPGRTSTGSAARLHQVPSTSPSAQQDLWQVLRSLASAEPPQLTVLNHRIAAAMRQRRRARDLLTSHHGWQEQLLGVLLGKDCGLPDLGTMHRLGVLGALLPEFEKVTGRFRIRGHSPYPIDVHALRSVAHLQQTLDTQEDLPFPPPPDRLTVPLLLAALLSGLGPSHPRVARFDGKGRLEQASRRLRLDAQQERLLIWLVKNCLLMAHVTWRRDSEDPHVLARFASQIGRPDRLNLLYLMTRSMEATVTPDGLSGHRLYQLTTVYDRTMALLDGDVSPEVTAGEGISVTASRETVLHERLRQSVLQGRFPQILFELRADLGTTQLTVATADSSGLLVMLCGVLSSMGLDICDARARTTQEGVAIDTFRLTRRNGGWHVRAPVRHRIQKLLLHLLRMRGGDESEGTSIPRIVHRSTVPPSFTHDEPETNASRVDQTWMDVDNDESPSHTIIEIHSPDRHGLLRDICDALNRCGLDIKLCRASTEGRWAVDVFYVREAQGGGRITDEARLESILEQLQRAIQQPRIPLGAEG